MKIGPYTLSAIETGTFALDGGAMFGVVPWVFWSKTNPPDERNRVTLAARCLLLVGDNRVILIDVGNGTKFTDKQKDIFRLDNSKNDLMSSLRAHGIHPADVTDIVLTHLHFDHAGGSTRIEQGRLVPSFPNARHYVQREHWNLSQHPTERDRASFMNSDFVLLNERGLLYLVDGEQEILPGIRVLVTNGHTASQQLPLISDGTTSLLRRMSAWGFLAGVGSAGGVRLMVRTISPRRVSPSTSSGLAARQRATSSRTNAGVMFSGVFAPQFTPGC